ncbi:MAG: amidohydrolase [Candidatus Sumerlaeia bacterium]|nr:amidohydrolase [Candidatus Sumerlaeia bacterium]
MIDRLICNARIYTQDPKNPQAQALAISRDRIIAVGGNELRQIAGPKTAIEDLGGAAVVPGFVDSHIHWEMTSLGLREVGLEYLPTRAATLQRIAEAVARAQSGQWIVGRGWAQGDWTDTPGQFPNAADLDRVAPANPAFFPARSGHAAWANSAAMRLAGITAATPDPPGGTIQRDAAGNPTGIFFEEAIGLVRAAVPKPRVEDVVSAMAEAQEAAWKTGLTGIHDYDGQRAFAAMQILHEEGRLGLRVLKHINDPDIGHAHGLRVRSGFGNDWLRIGGLKMFADGALGSVTALMIDPVEDDPTNRGIRVMEKQTMLELAREATLNGIPSTVHAIGDLAVRDVLDVFEELRRVEAAAGIPRERRRHRIEHTQLIHPDDVGRLAELDVIASIQPIHATADIDMADRHWGARSALGYNARVQIDRGARVVFGSDAPVEPYSPMIGIHAAVTRRRANGYPGPEGWYPEARVTVEEAIRCYTVEPAWAAGQEKVLGRLAHGYLADLVVLDRDPHTIDPHDLQHVRVTGTMIGGKWRWRA